MSIEVTKLVRKAPLAKGHKSILLAMADYASADGTDVFPGTKRLASDTGYSTRWIRKLRSDLIEMGLLVETRPSTPIEPAHYRIVLEAVRRLIDREEVSTPVEVASPPEGNHPDPLNSLPRPPEVSSPKPSVEPSVEPSDGAEGEIEQEVEELYQQVVDRGAQINNATSYKKKIRANIRPRIEARARESAIANAKLADIDTCSLCNSDGIVSWESKNRTPESERCTHNRTDYEGLELITRRDPSRREKQSQK